MPAQTFGFVPAGIVQDQMVGVTHLGGLFQSQSIEEKLEDRGDFETDAYRMELTLTLKPGDHRLCILSCGLGLIKGDWMIANKNMALERKGLWGSVLWRGRALKGEWSLQPGLWGERAGVPEAFELPRWKSVRNKVAHSPGFGPISPDRKPLIFLWRSISQAWAKV